MVGKRGGRSAAIRGAAAGCTLLMVAAVTGCGGDDKPAAAKHRPVAMTGRSGAALPVPHGRGSKVPDDFNGDGAPDLVLDDLVHDGLGDDAGIGVVYGKKGHGLVPGARQLLRPAKYAAPTEGETPAAFDSEASCDLDKDGFTDLVVSTDPPFDGQGQPPVPLQILFGGPDGLTHQGVKLVVPAQARFGNDWPDQPVCGDFDGDGSVDLTVHASGGRLSFLRGPFTRKGAPRAAGKPLTAPGNVPVGPAFDVDRDGYDDLLVRRTSRGSSPSRIVLGGPQGPARSGAALPSGRGLAVGRFTKGAGADTALLTTSGVTLSRPGAAALKATGTAITAGDFDGDGVAELVVSGGASKAPKVLPATGRAAVTVTPRAAGTTQVLEATDFDGDGRADLVVRTYRGESTDTIAVYPGVEGGALLAGKPQVTFSTAEF
ncbi:VCBS repeat-containing protein [Streptomyces sp. NBC_01003]|uniref:FG-GAP repeat domain-containing protein n=1 Tax=Streptomyces sp. NBC_01003 TaxID=2903714 RepID=UPI0038649411|nr:VCBS repeat-containing protein [Streptomyces sp. NBC_01003]